MLQLAWQFVDLSAKSAGAGAVYELLAAGKGWA
jgi:hypothetical protein